MATITKIMSNLNTSEWIKATSVTGNHGAYIIAIKEAKTATDICSIDDLKYVVMEVGIDSGLTDKPLTVTRIKLNFNEETSSDLDLNAKTAFTRISQMPSTLYFKVVSYGDATKEYKEGTMPVSINVLPF